MHKTRGLTCTEEGPISRKNVSMYILNFSYLNKLYFRIRLG